ncbi:unnamed protein product [Meloidogyne enterolobii]|uniref:Uncharacterized protein n=1 Tax=Meloidogyne enterolobii TaxID=390850 RepID=A0ACB0ZIB3_MELEN
MVSRDLTCDEIMPPLDDGESLVQLVRSATSTPSTTRLPRYQQPQEVSNKTKIIGGSSKSSHFINCQDDSATSTINYTTTVRDVLTRQIKNSKLKNEHLTGFSNQRILTSVSMQEERTSPPIVINTYLNHHGSHTPFNLSNGRVDVHKQKNSLITASNAFSSKTSNNSSNSHNYASIKSSFVSNTASYSSSHGSQIIKVAKLDNSSQQKQHQKILSSSTWASQQPIDSSIISRSPPQQLINNYSFQPSKSLSSSDKSTLNSQSAVNSNLPQQTVYSVVLQNRPHQPIEDDSTTQLTTKSPIKKVPNIPHTSPRPGILVKNSWNTQTTNKRGVGGVISSDNLSEINSFTNNGAVIDLMPNGSGSVDDLQRKRTRKQHFCDGDIASTTDVVTSPSDKFMRMELSGSRHRPSSFVEIPSSTQDGKCFETTTTTSIPMNSHTDPHSFSHFSTHIERIPKKRGRPKLSNSSIDQQKQQINLLPEKPFISSPKSNQIYSTNISTTITNSNNQYLHLSSPNSNVAASTNLASSDSTFHQSRIKRSIETAATFQTEMKTKRKYRKKTPELDPQTGQVMKKPRKKGPGRKSKREIELAAQQARESAILAEMGFPLPKSGSFSNSTTETTQLRQQHFVTPSTSANDLTNNYEHSRQRADQVSLDNKIADDEQMSITALCRFRTNSEHQQLLRRRRLTFSNFVDSSDRTLESFVRPKFHSMCEIKSTAPETEHFVPPIASTSQQQFEYSPLPSAESENTDLMKLLSNFSNDINTSLGQKELMEYREMLISLLTEKETVSEAKSTQRDSLRSSIKSRLSDYLRNELLDEEKEVSCNVFESQEQIKSAFDCLNLLPNACVYFNKSKQLLDLIRIKILARYLYRNLTVEFSKKKDLNKQNLPKLVPLSSFNTQTFTATKPINLLFEKKIEEMIDSRSKGLDIFSLEEREGNVDEKGFEKVEIESALDLLKNLMEKKSSSCNLQSSIDPFINSPHSSNNIDDLNSSIYANSRNSLPIELLNITRRQKENKQKRKLNKRFGIDFNQINKEEKMEDDLNDCDNSNEVESLQSFLQQLNSLCCRWNFSFQHIERLNNDIQTLLENDKNDEKIQERRQLTTIEVEKKKNNKALPPHKTSSLLFQPSNEFIEQIFKDVLDMKLMENNQQTENLPSTSSSIPSNDQSTTIKKHQQHPSDQSSSTEENQTKTDLSSLMLLQNIDEMLDSTEYISSSSREKLNCKYREILERNKIVAKNKQEGQQNIKQIQKKQLPHYTDDQHDTFLKRQINQTHEISKTTIGLMRDRSKLINSCVDCIHELINQPQDNTTSKETTTNSSKTTTKRAAHQKALFIMATTNSSSSCINSSEND